MGNEDFLRAVSWGRGTGQVIVFSFYSRFCPDRFTLGKGCDTLIRVLCLISGPVLLFWGEYSRAQTLLAFGSVSIEAPLDGKTYSQVWRRNFQRKFGGGKMVLGRARLKRLTILFPMVFTLGLVAILLALHPTFGHLLKHHPLAGYSPVYVWGSTLLFVSSVVFLNAYFFSRFVFSHVQRQEEEIVQRSEAMAAVDGIGFGMSNMADLEKILEFVVQKAKRILKAELSVLCLEEDGCFLPKAAEGPLEEFGLSLGQAPGPSAQAGCPARRTGESEERGGSSSCRCLNEELVKAKLAVPLVIQGKPIGMLCVCDRRPRVFSELEVALFNSLATPAALAVENARLQKRLQQMILAEERNRIAREMHDGLAQYLGFLCTRMGHLEYILSREGNGPLIDEIQGLKQLARDAYEEVRHSIEGLRGIANCPKPLVASLQEYISHFQSRTGIEVEFDVPDEETIRFGPDAECQLVRIIQEALANVAKHSGGKHAWLSFEAEKAAVRISVRDDGVGFKPSERNGGRQPTFGLATMRERAEKIGADIEIHSEPGRGTTVKLSLPREGRAS